MSNLAAAALAGCQGPAVAKRSIDAETRAALREWIATQKDLDRRKVEINRLQAKLRDECDQAAASLRELTSKIFAWAGPANSRFLQLDGAYYELSFAADGGKMILNHIRIDSCDDSGEGDE